jgi:ABC-type antimicrobial peptide transport system permease subunit
VVIVAAGGVLTVLGTETDYDLFQAGGLIAMLSGFLFSIPLLVGFVGRIASRLPMTGRLAARDAARHGRRTGAAVAAAVIALAVPIATSTYSLSRQTYELQPPRSGPGQDLPDYGLVRAAVTAASLPAALTVVAVATALVAAESRRSRQILVAVGAGPMVHRKLVAATSALLALVAAVLAVPAGLLPLVALWASQPPGPDRLPLMIPWGTIGIVFLLVPSVAALVGGIVARPPKVGSLLSPAA